MRTLPPADSMSLAPIPPRSRCANNVTLSLQLGSVCAPGARRHRVARARRRRCHGGWGRGCEGRAHISTRVTWGVRCGAHTQTHDPAPRPVKGGRRRCHGGWGRGGARRAHISTRVTWGVLCGAHTKIHDSQRGAVPTCSDRPPHGSTREPRPFRHTGPTAALPRMLPADTGNARDQTAHAATSPSRAPAIDARMRRAWRYDSPLVGRRCAARRGGGRGVAAPPCTAHPRLALRPAGRGEARPGAAPLSAEAPLPAKCLLARQRPSYNRRVVSFSVAAASRVRVRVAPPSDIRWWVTFLVTIKPSPGGLQNRSAVAKASPCHLRQLRQTPDSRRHRCAPPPSPVRRGGAPPEPLRRVQVRQP